MIYFLVAWLFPGLVLCLHQAIDQLRGKPVPKMIWHGRAVSNYLTYLAVLLLGPFIVAFCVYETIRRLRR